MKKTTKMLEKIKMFLAFKLFDVVFIMLINVKMPKIVGILTFMSMINSFSFELNIKKFYNLGLAHFTPTHLYSYLYV